MLRILFVTTSLLLFVWCSVAYCETPKDNNAPLSTRVDDALAKLGASTDPNSEAMVVAGTAMERLSEGIAEALRAKSWKKSVPGALKEPFDFDAGSRHYERVLAMAGDLCNDRVTDALLESLDYRNASDDSGPFSSQPKLNDWKISQPDLNCPAAYILIHERNGESVKRAILDFVTRGKYREMSAIEKKTLARIWLRITVKETRESREARGLEPLKEMCAESNQPKNPEVKKWNALVENFINVVQETAYPELDGLKWEENYKRKLPQKLEE